MDTADRKRRQISRRLFVSLGFSGCVWAFVVVVVVVVVVCLLLFVCLLILSVGQLIGRVGDCSAQNKGRDLFGVLCVLV